MTTSFSDALAAAGRSSRQIARTYYVIAGVYTLSASLIWGVNTIFLLRSGRLTLLEVFVANAIFTGTRSRQRGIASLSIECWRAVSSFHQRRC